MAAARQAAHALLGRGAGVAVHGGHRVHIGASGVAATHGGALCGGCGDGAVGLSHGARAVELGAPARAARTEPRAGQSAVPRRRVDARGAGGGGRRGGQQAGARRHGGPGGKEWAAHAGATGEVLRRQRGDGSFFCLMHSIFL